MAERTPIIIEEVLPGNSRGVRSTVVRSPQRAYWVSTIHALQFPYYPETLGTFQTKVFKFLDYKERIGRQAIPDADFSDACEEFLHLDRSYDFQNDPEGAINYHNQVVEKIAQMFEVEQKLESQPTANT